MKIKKFNENTNNIDEYIQYIVDSMEDYVELTLSNGYSTADGGTFFESDHEFSSKEESKYKFAFKAYRILLPSIPDYINQLVENKVENDIKSLLESYDDYYEVIKTLKGILLYSNLRSNFLISDDKEIDILIWDTNEKVTINEKDK